MESVPLPVPVPVAAAAIAAAEATVVVVRAAPTFARQQHHRLYLYRTSLCHH